MFSQALTMAALPPKLSKTANLFQIHIKLILSYTIYIIQLCKIKHSSQISFVLLVYLFTVPPYHPQPPDNGQYQPATLKGQASMTSSNIYVAKTETCVTNNEKCKQLHEAQWKQRFSAEKTLVHQH
jgi:hypothetical protein